MIKGRVNANQQATVSIDIIDSRGCPRPLEMVLDTGFTGYLTLPGDSIQQLGLPSVGQRTFELANGEFFEFDTYLATVSWHGRLIYALALRSDSIPLLGMTLLWGSRVTIDAINDGAVAIKEMVV